MKAKQIKVAIIVTLAIMLLGATVVSASSNVWYNFTINRGTGYYSWGTKDDYAPADVNFMANNNWQQGQEYFITRLVSAAKEPISITHTVHYEGLFHINYYSGYSSPGTRGIAIAYDDSQPYTNATAYGVWAP